MSQDPPIEGALAMPEGGPDYSQRQAGRLPGLGNHLAIVVTLHLLTEFLLDRLIKARSPTPARILDDSRTFTYSVKLVLVRNMGLIEDEMFRNLDALRKLRNDYAHELDLDLPAKLNQRFAPSFSEDVIRQVGDDPESAGIGALMTIRDLTFGQLHTVCARLGVDLEYSSSVS